MANKIIHFNGILALLVKILNKDYSFENKLLIATCSQAVDDFTQDEMIHLDNGIIFATTVTAHKMLDLKNLNSYDSVKVWLPFHFFPDTDGICKPNTDNINRLQHWIRNKKNHMFKRDYYILVGIFLHIFVDTFAHQDFVGVNCEYNNIQCLKSECDNFIDKTKNKIIDTYLDKGNVKIGHSQALSYPDDTYRVWEYYRKGKKIIRNNPEIYFNLLTEEIPKALRRLGLVCRDLTEEEKEKFQEIINIENGQEQKEKFQEIINIETGQEENKPINFRAEVLEKEQDRRFKLKLPSLEDFYKSNWAKFQNLAELYKYWFKNNILHCSNNIKLDTKIY